MATQYDTQIQQLYVAYFNRPADASGIAHWANFMATGAGTDEQKLAQISAAFATSLEYQVEYSQSNFAGIVTQVYNNLFGHAPDSVGLAFWVNALTNKDMTVDNVVRLISQGAQGTDKDAFNAKVTVAVAFTNALDTDAEKAGYTGKEANDAAKAILADITTPADATAAIEKAALDAHVAAVIKAGVPFSLETGLAALGAAQAAEKAFYEEFADANDLDSADEDDVTAAVDAAEADLIDLIEDESFADASEGVQNALIADQEDLNAEALVEAGKVLKTAQDAVAKVTGLGNAIAASTSAKAAVETARDDAVDVQAAYSSAATSFFGRNTGAEINYDEDTGLGTITNAAGTTIASQAADGTWKVATGVTASNYPGLSALVTAGNNLDAAYDEIEAVEEAAALAQLRVELLDQSGVALGFTFVETEPKDAAKPTYNEIVNELSARSATSVTADAALAAADEDDANYADLVEAAEEAATALSAFEGQIRSFNGRNTTELADAVIAAEEGTLGLATADVAEVEGLAAAIAATTPTPAQQTLLTDNADLVTAFKAAQTAATSDDMDVRIEALGTEGAQAAIDALADAREALEDAQAVAKELEGLQKAIADATAEFTAEDYAAPITLGASNFGTTDADIFVASDVNSTVTNFGRSGDDVLFVGSGFTLNKGALSTGNDNALEVFFTQNGNNAVITIESKAYGSDSGDVHTVTLTGVNIADLTFEDGIITL